MARNRMLNPDFWFDEELAVLSPHARLLYMGLWGICDDHAATLPNRPSWIKAQVFPYEDVDVRVLLTELSGSGHLLVFHHNGQEFLYIRNFFKHQRVEKPSKQKYPEYVEDSRGVVGEELGNTPAKVSKLSKEKLREAKLSEVKGSLKGKTFASSNDSADELSFDEKKTIALRQAKQLSDLEAE